MGFGRNGDRLAKTPTRVLPPSLGGRTVGDQSSLCTAENSQTSQIGNIEFATLLSELLTNTTPAALPPDPWEPESWIQYRLYSHAALHRRRQTDQLLPSGRH